MREGAGAECSDGRFLPLQLCGVITVAAQQVRALGMLAADCPVSLGSHARLLESSAGALQER